MSNFRGSVLSQGRTSIGGVWELPSELQPTLKDSPVIRQVLAKERAMNSYLSVLHCLPITQNSFSLCLFLLQKSLQWLYYMAVLPVFKLRGLKWRHQTGKRERMKFKLMQQSFDRWHHQPRTGRSATICFYTCSLLRGRYLPLRNLLTEKVTALCQTYLSVQISIAKHER